MEDVQKSVNDAILSNVLKLLKCGPDNVQLFFYYYMCELHDFIGGIQSKGV